MARTLARPVQLRTNHKSAPPHWGLTTRDWRAVQRVRARLREILPNGELKSLMLYGSHARGEARADSDIDLFLVYDNVPPERETWLKESMLDLAEDYPRLHIFDYRADKVAQHNGISPLIYNVAHQGVALEGVPVPKLEINRREVAQNLMADAKEKLEVAQLNLDHDFYRDAISRAYYAVLHAADAALATQGFVPKSHAGTNTLFSYHLIKKGLVDKQFKGLVGRAAGARLQADYYHNVKFTREDAEYWLERAKEFVAAIEAAVPGWLAEE